MHSGQGTKQADAASDNSADGVTSSKHGWRTEHNANRARFTPIDTISYHDAAHPPRPSTLLATPNTIGNTTVGLF